MLNEMIDNSIVAIIGILPIGISILAFIYNFKKKIRCDRLTFAKIFAAISIVPLIFIYADLSMLLGWPSLPINLSSSFLFLAIAALAYPFCALVCQRNFDAGFSKYAALLTFLPYLNVAFFIILTLTPSTKKM